MSENLSQFLHPNQATRHELHSEGVKGYTDDALSSFRRTIGGLADDAADRTKSGTARALGAAGVVMAVGAGLALGEVVAVGVVAYGIGKKLGEFGSRRFRNAAHEALDCGEYNRE